MPYFIYGTTVTEVEVDVLTGQYQVLSICQLQLVLMFFLMLLIRYPYPLSVILTPSIPYQILRVDLMEDCGQSMSPEVDVGQAEGAFIMGLGYFTSEELVHDSDTGVLLTNRTWVRKNFTIDKYEYSHPCD